MLEIRKINSIFNNVKLLENLIDIDNFSDFSTNKDYNI